MAKALTDIRSLARVHTPMCIRVLKSIAQQPDAPPSARVAAITVLLDRGWGRPQQSLDVNITKHNAADYTREDLASILAGTDARNGSGGTAQEDGRGSEPDSLH